MRTEVYIVFPEVHYPTREQEFTCVKAVSCEQLSIRTVPIQTSSLKSEKVTSLKTVCLVWYLLIQYLSFVQMKNFNLVKVLSFILQLGFCSLGVDYVCDNDDQEMSQVIQHFRELGLVFKRKVLIVK